MTYHSGSTFRKGPKVYHSYGYTSQCYGILMIFTIAVGLIATPIYYQHTQTIHMTRLGRFNQVKEMDLMPITSSTLIGSNVTAMSSGPIKSTVYDDYTSIEITGLSLERDVEYCQWKEVSHRHCASWHTRSFTVNGKSKKSTTCTRYVTNYNYYKGWMSYQIPSIFFHKPLGHHNPIRKSIPSKEFTSDSASFNVVDSNIKVELNADLLKKVKAKKERVVWSHLKTSSFWKRFWVFEPATIHFEPTENLYTFKNSPASIDEGFTYIPDVGYFYSPVQMSDLLTIMSTIGKIMEGSFLQFGDIIPSCTAGDIRISYHAKIPNVITVIGEKTAQYENVAYLSKLFIFKDDPIVSTVYENHVSVTQIINSEINISQQSTILGWFLLIIWSFTITRLCLMALKGIDLAESYICWITCSISACLLMHCTIWFNNYTSKMVEFIIILFGFLTYIIIKSMPVQDVLPGFHSLQCMLYQWVDIPFEYVGVDKKYM